MTSVTARLAVEGELPSLAGATEWINFSPVTPAGQRGKVVLVDIWTYTCVNWLRTLPYVRAWAAKYKDHGPVVIGVHSPEFPFEKEIENVRRSANQMRVDYPIAVDSRTREYIWDEERDNSRGSSHCARRTRLPRRCIHVLRECDGVAPREQELTRTLLPDGHDRLRSSHLG